MVAVCVAALLRGDWEEKVTGGIYLAACLTSLAVEQRPWVGPQGAVILIDAVVLVSATIVAMGSSKLWPIFAAALQVLTFGAHLAFILAQGRLGVVGYLTVLALWSYGTIACLSWGLWRASVPLTKIAAVAGLTSSSLAVATGPTGSGLSRDAPDRREPVEMS